ncbi:MAG: XrtN system VIT domain-containing protein, partial [Flavobacterium sp.]
MKKMEINAFLNDKIGVKISMIVTLLSSMILIGALIGSSLDYKSFETLAVANLLIEFTFGIVVTYKFLRNNNKYIHLLPFIFLNWFIGCFSTNIYINIFENLPIWVYCTTFLFCLTNFVLYSPVKNNYVNVLSYFINGCSYLLIIYYAFFLIPISVISVIGIIVLGLGFYGLVPAIVLIVHTIILSKKILQNKNYIYAFCSGIAAVIMGLTLFIVLLNVESQKINKTGITKSFDYHKSDLPN